MRLYPQNLRSVILSGTLPANSYQFHSVFSETDSYIRYVLVSCSEQKECKSKYPSVIKEFDEDWKKLPIQKKSQIRSIVSLLGGTVDGVRDIPNVINMALQGKQIQISSDENSLVPNLSWGVNGVVNCLEQVDFMNSSELSQDEQQSRQLGSMTLKDRIDTCRRLGINHKLPEIHIKVNKSIPTLLLHGEFDGRYPVRLLNYLEPLPRLWQKVIVENSAHDVNWTTCGLQIMSQFLENPERKLNVTCKENPIQFY